MKMRFILILIYSILIHSLPVFAKDTTSINKESFLFLQACICITLLLASGIMFIIYYKMRRKEDNPLKLSLYPSRKIPIALCSYIQHGEIQQEDFAALFIQWAQQGYLQISEEDTQIYLIKKQPLPKQSPSYEQYLFTTLFQHESKICINDLNQQEYLDIWDKAKQLLEETIETNTTHKIYKKTSLFLLTLRGLCIGILVFLIVFSTLYPVTQLMKESLLYSSLSAIGVSICFVLWGIYMQKEETCIKQEENKGSFLLNIVTSIIVIIIIKLLLDAKANMLYLAITFSSILFISNLLLLNGGRTRRGYIYLQDICKIQNCILHIRYTYLKQLLQQDPHYYYRILPYAYALNLDKIWKAKFETYTISYPYWFETTKVCFQPHERLERIHHCIDTLYQNMQTLELKEDKKE